jgi:hypothetical protein
MKKTKLLITIITLSLGGMVGCGDQKNSVTERPLFKKVYKQKKSHSDKKAVRLAVQVTDSMGGYDTWQEKRYLSWVFLGMRSWIWDKKTGDVRMNSRKDSLTILMNLKSRDGKVFKGGKPVTNPDTLDKYLKVGYRSWANDSYWVFMPFKLLDPGVQLTYQGKEASPKGDKTHLIRVQFDSVGVTPQNQYDVFINPDRMLVTAWKYYREPGSKPLLTTPWTGYRDYNGLKLATSRGGKYKITEISVRDSINREVFDTYNPYDSLQSKKPEQPPS